MKIVHIIDATRITSKYTLKLVKAVHKFERQAKCTFATPWRTRIAFWIAYKLPKRVVYWAAVRVWAGALIGSKHTHNDIVKITMAKATTEWEQSWRLR